MKKFLFLVVAISTTFLAQAQNDPAAKVLLDKVSKKVKGLSSVLANYTLSVTSRAGKLAGQKKGEIYLKGQKYKITEQSMQLLSDGKRQWRYEPDANEVTVSSVDNSGNGITPQKLLTNFYDKDFLYKLNGPATVNGKKVKEIELTPTDKRKSFYKIYVYVDEAQSMIISSKVYENSGNVYNYTLSNLKPNVAMADNMFVFDKTKYPGVEVISQ